MNIFFLGMIISMAIYIVLGFALSKGVKDANDFYVAGRNAPTVLIVGSLIASYCSTGLFMGDAAEAYSGYFSPLLRVAVMQVVGYIIGGVFFGRYLRRTKVLTVPEFFEKRFCSRKVGSFATIVLIIMIIIYMLSTMQGIGTLMNYVTGIDYNLCILLALITFTLLTAMSGSKGVLISDTLMFGIFTLASVVAIFVVVYKGGGWYSMVQDITKENPDIYSWHGVLPYVYSTGIENIIWSAVYGIVWMSVCMVSPWQSSRYLMAKNEHVVMRSSVFAALGVFILEFIIEFGATLMNAFHTQINIDNPSHIMIWMAMDLLPKVLGVIMLTGVLAAAISSATTFLSLISSSIANDLLKVKDERKSVLTGRIVIVIVSVAVYLLAYFNPPQIFWIMYLSATVLAASWLPVCIASIWSKRVTKMGAFLGMLFGFFGCAAIKIYTSISDITLPIYLDCFVVGIALNVIGLVIGSVLTQVTEEEKEQRALLFVIPEEEKDLKEIKITKCIMLGGVVLGVFVSAVLICFWVIPYLRALV